MSLIRHQRRSAPRGPVCCILCVSHVLHHGTKLAVGGSTWLKFTALLSCFGRSDPTGALLGVRLVLFSAHTARHPERFAQIHGKVSSSPLLSLMTLKSGSGQAVRGAPHAPTVPRRAGHTGVMWEIRLQGREGGREGTMAKEKCLLYCCRWRGYRGMSGTRQTPGGAMDPSFAFSMA